MKKQLIGIVIGIGLLGLAAQAILPGLAAAQTAQPASKALLGATVQITLYAPLGENSREKLYATGLGTLIRAGNEKLIITHDHWGAVLDGVSKAQFASADNRPLLELDGAAFRALIRHRDGGAMILEAPELLLVSRPSAPRLKPVAVGDGENVQVGDTVTVAYRLPAAGRESVSAFEAVVQSLEIKDGRPVWRLQSAQGEQVIPGDSGGGIWKDGELVGNLWACVIETVYSSVAPDGEDVATDRSVAAVLAADDLLDSVPAENPAIVQSGRSIPDESRVPPRGGVQAGDPGL
jgi:hypothetical protein